MPNKPADESSAETLTKERAEALGLALAGSLGSMTQMWERQMSTLLGLSAILAAMPQTAEVDLKRVGAVIHLMTSRHPDPEKMREDVSRAASIIINVARRLRDTEASGAAKQGSGQSAGTPPEPIV